MRLIGVVTFEGIVDTVSSTMRDFVCTASLPHSSGARLCDMIRSGMLQARREEIGQSVMKQMLSVRNLNFLELANVIIFP